MESPRHPKAFPRIRKTGKSVRGILSRSGDKKKRIIKQRRPREGLSLQADKEEPNTMFYAFSPAKRKKRQKEGQVDPHVMYSSFSDAESVPDEEEMKEDVSPKEEIMAKSVPDENFDKDAGPSSEEQKQSDPLQPLSLFPGDFDLASACTNTDTSFDLSRDLRREFEEAGRRKSDSMQYNSPPSLLIVDKEEEDYDALDISLDSRNDSPQDSNKNPFRKSPSLIDDSELKMFEDDDRQDDSDLSVRNLFSESADPVELVSLDQEPADFSENEKQAPADSSESGKIPDEIENDTENTSPHQDDAAEAESASPIEAEQENIPKPCEGNDDQNTSVNQILADQSVSSKPRDKGVHQEESVTPCDNETGQEPAVNPMEHDVAEADSSIPCVTNADEETNVIRHDDSLSESYSPREDETKAVSEAAVEDTDSAPALHGNGDEQESNVSREAAQEESAKPSEADAGQAGSTEPCKDEAHQEPLTKPTEKKSSKTESALSSKNENSPVGVGSQEVTTPVEPDAGATTQLEGEAEEEGRANLSEDCQKETAVPCGKYAPQEPTTAMRGATGAGPTETDNAGQIDASNRKESESKPKEINMNLNPTVLPVNHDADPTAPTASDVDMKATTNASEGGGDHAESTSEDKTGRKSPGICDGEKEEEFIAVNPFEEYVEQTTEDGVEQTANVSFFAVDTDEKDPLEGNGEQESENPCEDVADQRKEIEVVEDGTAEKQFVARLGDDAGGKDGASEGPSGSLNMDSAVQSQLATPFADNSVKEESLKVHKDTDQLEPSSRCVNDAIESRTALPLKENEDEMKPIGSETDLNESTSRSEDDPVKKESVTSSETDADSDQKVSMHSVRVTEKSPIEKEAGQNEATNPFEDDVKQKFKNCDKAAASTAHFAGHADNGASFTSLDDAPEVKCESYQSKSTGIVVDGAIEKTAACQLVVVNPFDGIADYEDPTGPFDRNDCPEGSTKHVEKNSVPSATKTFLRNDVGQEGSRNPFVDDSDGSAFATATQDATETRGFINLADSLETFCTRAKAMSPSNPFGVDIVYETSDSDIEDVTPTAPLKKPVKKGKVADPVEDTDQPIGTNDLENDTDGIAAGKSGSEFERTLSTKALEDDASQTSPSYPLENDSDHGLSTCVLQADGPGDTLTHSFGDNAEQVPHSHAVEGGTNTTLSSTSPLMDDPAQYFAKNSSKKGHLQHSSKEDGEISNGSGKDSLAEEKIWKGGDLDRSVSSTPPPSAVEDSTRTVNHARLSAFESRRRSGFSEKLESISLKWQSTVDLFRSGVAETARAERLVLASVLATEAYGEAMQAIYEDVFLDDEGNTVGNTVVGAWRQNRLSAQRSHRDYTRVLVPDENAWRDSIHTPEERRGGMLTSLIDTQSVMANRFTEYAKNVSSVDAHEVTCYRQQLQPQLTEMERAGKGIISELEAMETRVTGLWDAYVRVFGEALILPTPSTPEKGKESTPPVSPKRASPFSSFSNVSPKWASEGCPDLWLVEMRYGMAVDYQRQLWEKALPELQKLIESVVEKEAERRTKLHESLLDFLPRQRRFFSSITSVHSPVLQELVDRQMDQEVEEDVHKTIQKHSKTVQMKETKHTSSIINRSRRKGGQQELSDIEGLESPLTSNLLYSMKVVERKIKSFNGNIAWQWALAVVTIDSYLHLFELFDMPQSLDATIAPEAAFAKLAPVPVEDVNDWEPQTNKALLGNLIPAISVFLPNCSAVASPDDAREFEMSETGVGRFGQFTERKLFLRTTSKEETKKWIDCTLETKMWSKDNLECEGSKEYVVV